MADVRSEEDLLKALEPVVQGLGYSVVEVHFGRAHRTVHANVVIYRPEGVSVDGCAEVSRTILPRMEILLDSQDISLEVASPGIDRKIKSPREYSIFSGRGVRINLRDGTSTVEGIILSSDGSGVTVQTKDGGVNVLYDQIQKAKLDETQEVR